jgi:hypothetical protein
MPRGGLRVRKVCGVPAMHYASSQVLPSAAPRHAVTLWYFSAGELLAEGGQAGGRPALHPVEPGPELQPGQTSPGAAREGIGEAKGMGACSAASASGLDDTPSPRTMNMQEKVKARPIKYEDSQS